MKPDAQLSRSPMAQCSQSWEISERHGTTKAMTEMFNRQWSVADHESPKGKRFSERYASLTEAVSASSQMGLWQYFRRHTGKVTEYCTVVDQEGREFTGLNLGSQDYLGLAQNTNVADAAVAAIQNFGTHSSGSAPMGGGSVASTELSEKISSILGLKYTLLFPTGWAAGYGAIRGLVRNYDYVVMDSLAHNCLAHGSYSATDRVSLFLHNSVDSLTKRLERIRRVERDAAILVVFETLYSMDSDSPPIAELIREARRFDAHILADVAHDFGVLGSQGRGLLADNGGYGSVDLIIGSFSKVFASIGGFVSSNDLNLIRAIQGFSGSYTFSNFLIPPQIASVKAAVDIAFSPEGDQLRRQVLGSCQVFRSQLDELGIGTDGVDSAMAIIKVGDEHIARSAYRRILEKGVILNCIEFPAVRKKHARFRVQFTPRHRDEDLRQAAKIVASAIDSVA